jgi:hypothetical protein
VDLHDLKQQVLSNCDVTDAQHAGIYSVCGLVMRLRDLYKWEHRLLPWQDDAPAKVLDWIGEKEALWETLMDASYGPIGLDGRHYEAFDTTAINERLRPHRLFYGAGYAHSLKPTFFLADIERVTQVSGHTVITTGTEYARDLLTLPAFSQEGGVVLRLEAARMFLWDHILYLGRSGRNALDYAARACGLRTRATTPFDTGLTSSGPPRRPSMSSTRSANSRRPFLTVPPGSRCWPITPIRQSNCWFAP